MKKVLAFETSCDDTAIAVVDETGTVLCDVIYSQVEEFKLFGGVVPEVGSRAHIEQIMPLTRKAFKEAALSIDDIDAVAATFAPGLIGPLLVGAQFAKGIALARKIPLIAVHHLEGHVLAGSFMPAFPKDSFISLIASGGHSALYLCDEHLNIELLGETLDDAAGEAFDKIGRAMGLGYPAGTKIESWALRGDPSRFSFAIAMQREAHFNFSFSGLKTKALRYILEGSLDDTKKADLAASVQEAIAGALCERAIKACINKGITSLVIGGGVSANARLRTLLEQQCKAHNIDLFLPPKRHCTDNAVMIAKVALLRLKEGIFSDLSTDVRATLSIEQKQRLYARVCA